MADHPPLRTVTLGNQLPPRAIARRVRDMSFFELLDSLCGIFHRAGIHGNGWAGNAIGKKCYNVNGALCHALRETLPRFSRWYGDSQVGYYHYLGGDGLYDMVTGRGTHTWAIVEGAETVHCDNWWSPRKCQHTPIVSPDDHGGFGSNFPDMAMNPESDVEFPLLWVLDHDWVDEIIGLLAAFEGDWNMS